MIIQQIISKTFKLEKYLLASTKDRSPCAVFG